MTAITTRYLTKSASEHKARADRYTQSVLVHSQHADSGELAAARTRRSEANAKARLLLDLASELNCSKRETIIELLSDGIADFGCYQDAETRRDEIQEDVRELFAGLISEVVTMAQQKYEAK
jgi:hypothetical protein